MGEGKKHFEIVVIGGGPGGYPAAITASQKNKSVALIDEKGLGGTCLHRGCIPSKALISQARTWKKFQHAEDYGITVDGTLSFDYAKVAKHKDEVVGQVASGLRGLVQSNGITHIKGYAKFLSPKEIKVNGEESAIITADKVIIATGSEPRNMAAFPFDYKKIHDSTSLLALTKLPKSLAIIGGGIIGMEFASLFNAFGVDVTVLELMPTILPMECKSVSSILTKASQEEGIRIHTSVTVEGIKETKTGVAVQLTGGEVIESEMALVSVGRKLNTDNIGLENTGVIVDKQGIVEVNSKMETTVPDLYAVGDIASKWWLAHVATHQGVVAATNAAGGQAKMHYNAIPSVIFTDPEIGTVGYTLDQAIQMGYDAKISSFPFKALGKAQATGDTEGFAQVVVNKETGAILGAQVVGHEAGNLVSEMAVAIANELTVESITETIHAHPTMAEIWLEAAMKANDTPLHLPPERKRRQEKVGA